MNISDLINAPATEIQAQIDRMTNRQVADMLIDLHQSGWYMDREHMLLTITLLKRKASFSESEQEQYRIRTPEYIEEGAWK